MDKRELKNLWEAAERILPRFGSHGIEHTKRVYRLCLALGERLGADLEVLLPAAILHDIGRRPGVENHAEESARLSKELLAELDFEEPKNKEIINAIKDHSFSGGRRSRTLEGEILSDADKLDALGAVGVYRAATYGGEVGLSLGDFIRHFHEKLLRLPDLLYTEPAREMALQRRGFMVGYLRQLDREIKLET